MKTQILLSVIIPVYNVQFYLEKCVNSLLIQEGDFEIILIDDGSTDKSGEICDKLKSLDDRIKVVHQENGGVSSARNTGIALAKGKYITFVDSDDYVSPSYIASIFGYLKNHDCDLFIFNYFEDKGKKFVANKFPIEAGIYENPLGRLMLFMTKSYRFFHVPWNKIYKKDIIFQESLLFDTSINFGEDTNFNVHYMKCCKNFYICNDALYYYVKNPFGAVAVRKLSYLDDDNKLFHLFLTTINENAQSDVKVYVKETHKSFLLRLNLAVHDVIQNNLNSKKEVTEKINSLPYVENLLSFEYDSKVHKNYLRKLKHIKKGQWKLYFLDRVSFCLMKFGKDLKKHFANLKSRLKLMTKNSIIRRFENSKVKPQVVFISFNGKQYSDNPKAISEKLHELAPQTKIVWLFRKPYKFAKICPKYVKRVKFNFYNLTKYLATSQVWIDNDALTYKRNLISHVKSPAHLFIQTWHGDRGIKRSFYSIPEYRGEPFSLELAGLCDYILTGSTHAEKVYTEMFRYKGEFLKVGCPRNDLLFDINQEKVAKIKAKLCVEPDTKLLLYAPTFRSGGFDSNTNINLDQILEILAQKYSCDWKIMIRGHHLVPNFELTDKQNVINVSDPRFDMADLLCVTDMLITDYSSSAGDFAITGRPILLYVPDYNLYSNVENGTLFNLETSPFIITKSQTELEEKICNLTPAQVKSSNDNLLKMYGCYEDGHATESVCQLIIEKLNNKK